MIFIKKNKKNRAKKDFQNINEIQYLISIGFPFQEVDDHADNRQAEAQRQKPTVAQDVPQVGGGTVERQETGERPGEDALLPAPGVQEDHDGPYNRHGLAGEDEGFGKQAARGRPEHAEPRDEEEPRDVVPGRVDVLPGPDVVVSGDQEPEHQVHDAQQQGDAQDLHRVGHGVHQHQGVLERDEEGQEGVDEVAEEAPADYPVDERRHGAYSGIYFIEYDDGDIFNF